MILPVQCGVRRGADAPRTNLRQKMRRTRAQARGKQRTPPKISRTAAEHRANAAGRLRPRNVKKRRGRKSTAQQRTRAVVPPPKNFSGAVTAKRKTFDVSPKVRPNLKSATFRNGTRDKSRRHKKHRGRRTNARAANILSGQTISFQTAAPALSHPGGARWHIRTFLPFSAAQFSAFGRCCPYPLFQTNRPQRVGLFTSAAHLRFLRRTSPRAKQRCASLTARFSHKSHSPARDAFSLRQAFVFRGFIPLPRPKQRRAFLLLISANAALSPRGIPFSLLTRVRARERGRRIGEHFPKAYWRGQFL